MGKRKQSRYAGRKPQHGHPTRALRRLLRRPWFGPPVPARVYGDPATTGRQESASARRRRRAGEARCRAGGHAWRYLGSERVCRRCPTVEELTEQTRPRRLGP